MKRDPNIIIVLVLVISIFEPTLGAFGDRIRPITPNPLYTRNATVHRLHLQSTTTSPKESEGSPEPGDDEIPGTPVDTIANSSHIRGDAAEGDSNGIYPDYDVEDEGKPYERIEVPDEELNETSNYSSPSTSDITVSDIYPLDPPQSISTKDTKENISGSDTYDRYHYAVPPRVNPYDRNKVVFLSPIRPQPGHHHESHPTVVKKIVRITDTPVYRDGGPRIRYIKKSLTGRTPSHRYPMSTFSHPHEFHHHPNHDAKFYGYIPGIPGKPWKDYPLYSSVPLTGFDCKLTKYPGFYADIDSGCQVWHYCQLDGRHDKFLCPNGTIFNQATRVCDWWFNVDCSSSLYKYNVNADMYKTKTIKKVLHIHPGKQPHVHKIPTKGKGVYVFSGLGGSKTRPISLSRKIHKHHFMHHPHPGYPLLPRSHPHKKPFLPPYSSGHGPPFGSRHPKAHHSLGDGHHHSVLHDRSIHHLTGGLPVHPHHGGHRHFPPGVVRVRKVVIPQHHLHRLHHHHQNKPSYFDRIDHSLHHLPLSDPLGRIPHHGHLILHHHQKAKRR